MVYELYVDSLFWINFVMNLYLLILVNQSTMRTATRMRILAGAGAGAVVYVAAFLVEMPAAVKWPLMLAVGTGVMLEVTFRPRNLRSIVKLFGRLGCDSFLVGGVFLFLCGISPLLQRILMSMTGLLGVGAVVVLVLGAMRERAEREKMTAECRVRLITEENCMTATALVDSGNHLTEPISGKPVSVIHTDIFKSLWAQEPQLYRVIPYHSVGTKHGMLKAYLLPGLEVELGGMRKVFTDVYVAVSEDAGASGVILHPGVLAEAGERKGKQNAKKDAKNGSKKDSKKGSKRKERVDKDDLKSGNAGKTAV